MLCSLCTISSSDLGFSLTFTLTVRDRWEPGTDLLISFVKGYKTGKYNTSALQLQIYLYWQFLQKSGATSQPHCGHIQLYQMKSYGWAREAREAREALNLAAAISHKAQECSSPCKHTLELRETSHREAETCIFHHVFFFKSIKTQKISL